MFSKRTVMIVAGIVLFGITLIILSVSYRHPFASYGIGKFAVALVAPLQKAVTRTIRFSGATWREYFYLVSVSKENERLRRHLSLATERIHQCQETAHANERLRDLLNFKQNQPRLVLAAEVIGRDPSPWYKSVTIDKGAADGLRKGLPVVVPEGIVGQVTEVSLHFAKVLLMIDRNNAVDALVQGNRARGIIKGEPTGSCRFDYVLRKHEIQPGDIVISSGLDGVYPKGLRVGRVVSAEQPASGIFQEVRVQPFVDFERMEEILVLLDQVEGRGR
jgi:rod shape-determining protein MreC